MSTLVGGAAPQPYNPRGAEVKHFLYQNAVIGETRRMRQLDRYEAHYACRQYSHLQSDWWGMSADQAETISPEIQVPMGWTQPALAMSVRAKRPTAPYNLCKAVVDRFTGLLFSESRKPDVVVEGDPMTEEFFEAAMEQMRFWPKLREARTMGGALGSVLITVHLRDGRFCLEVHNPKHCQVVWKDRRTLTPVAVLKLYKYPVEEDIKDEKTGEIKGTRIVEYLYRRIITEEDDTVYKPVRLEPGADLAWDPESFVQHDLGFFPGVWIQNLPVLDQEDGDPDCHGSWQNFDTIDRLLSQMNKAVLLNLDPTLVLGVDPKVSDMLGGVRTGSDGALQVGQGGDAKYLEITGSGVDSGLKVYGVLKQNTLDVVRCVLVDPSTISGSAQSAKAIEYIYAPMLEKADDLRAQYGDLGIVPLLLVIEQIARKFIGQEVILPDGRKGRYGFRLPMRKDAEGKMVQPTLGPGGYIRVNWGPYFAPTENDKQLTVQNIVAAKTGGIIDEETAIKAGAPVFGIRDTASVLKKVQQEKKDLAAMAGLGDGSVPDDTEESDKPDDKDEKKGPPAGGGGKP